MAQESEVPAKDGMTLVNAVENVLRKLIRLLIGRLSLKKLQELIQFIYIEEAGAWLEKKQPGKKPTLTDRALLTGIDIRTIKKTLRQRDLDSPVSDDSAQLEGFMPMFKLLDLWMNHEDFFDSQKGKPKILKIAGAGPTFSDLVKKALPSRGLSPNQVIKRLKEIDVVAISPSDGTIRLLQEDNIFISEAELDSLDVGFAAIGNLTDTVRHNIQTHPDQGSKFFQRGCWNYQFNPETIDQAREVINGHLREMDKKSRALLTSLAETESRAGQVTVGISMFYFEEKDNDA